MAYKEIFSSQNINRNCKVLPTLSSHLWCMCILTRQEDHKENKR